MSGLVVTRRGAVELARPLFERAERVDGNSPVSDQAVLAAQQGQRELLLFAEAESGPIIAAGVVGQGELDLVVDPDARGRGIGRAALAELLNEAPGQTVRAWAHGTNPAADSLLSAASFAPVRSLLKMELAPALLPTPASNPTAGSDATDPLRTAFPEGFTLSSFDSARAATEQLPSDAERWVRVNAAAFATHPEQGRITVDDFALMQQEPWFDAHDLLLLSAPGSTELAGSTWVKTVRDAQTGEVETELYAIGVDPRFAGQGLGKGLLAATLTRMAAQAPDRVSLYVDGENERAVNMYRASGFHVATRSQQWQRTASEGNS